MTLRVRIEGRDRAAMTDLVRKHRVDVVRTTARQGREGNYAVDAVVPPDLVDSLTAAGYRIDVIEDAEKVAQQRRADIDWHPADRPGGKRPDRITDRIQDIRDRGPMK